MTFAANRKPVMRINLDAIEKNLNSLCERGDIPVSSLIAVVKKSAYGLGSAKVGHFLASLGVSFFAVASLEEARVLRGSGIDGEILILENLPVDYYHIAEELDFIHPIVDISQLDDLLDRASQKSVRLHLCIDTGMRRNGIEVSQLEDPIIMAKIAKLSPSIEAVYTHYHSADETDRALTLIQRDLFEEAKNALQQVGVTAVSHSANSAGTLLYDFADQYVRTGIALYGCSPDSANPLDCLEESVTILSEVTSVRPIATGESVGYGATWHAPVDGFVATVSLGYANGLPRALSGSGFEVSIKGTTYPLIGRVTMDYCLVWVDGAISVGDEVTFCNPTLSDAFSIDRMAVCANTIGYEVLCRFGQGLRREYYRHGVRISADERSIF